MTYTELPQTFWAYLAGFFDGEGNICCTSPSFRLQLAQSGWRGKVLMEEFRRIFKEECKLPGKIRVTPWIPNAKNMKSWPKKPKNPQTSYRLTVTHRDSVRFILSRMFPFLKIKKVETQDVLRYFRLFPKNQGWNKTRDAVCGKGHPFNQSNTGYINKLRKDGQQYRYCVQCSRERARSTRAGL